jgi:hypothetical protein
LADISDINREMEDFHSRVRAITEGTNEKLRTLQTK